MTKTKKGTLIGYFISGPDNDSYMNSDQYEVNICDCLDYVKHRHLHLPPGFKLTKKYFDFSYTYDSYLIVSDRVRDFCIENKYEGIVFYPLQKYPKKFFMDILNVKTYHTGRSKTEFIEFNPVCDEYNEIVGATPVCLRDDEPLADGFYRTDIEFGRSYAKGPLYMIGIETKEKMKRENFKGLCFEEILTKYAWEKSFQ